MDILKLALLHDMALVNFYVLATMANILEMEQSENNVYKYIYRLN